jgi:RNA polymerase sigma-70 factor (ECF subfamily)
MSDPHDHSDASVLVKQALDQFESPLINYAASILHGDEDRARDVVQEAFLRLWQADHEKVRENVKAWLYTVCRNRCLDILRKDNRLDIGNEDAIAGACDWRPDPSGHADTHELTDRVWQLVERLSHIQREVIKLKYIHDASYKDIARITGLTIGNVGFIMHTAIKKLRELLNRELTEHPSP